MTAKTTTPIAVETKKAAVTEVIKATLDGKKIKKSDIAEKFGFSVRSLNRYIEQFGAEIQAEIETNLSSESQAVIENAQVEDKAEQKQEAAVVTTNEDKPKSKVEIARDIFKDMEGAKRKEVIEAFMTKANLTKAGAATYYYNLTKEAKK